jgi:hypothetical protein
VFGFYIHIYLNLEKVPAVILKIQLKKGKGDGNRKRGERKE